MRGRGGERGGVGPFAQTANAPTLSFASRSPREQGGRVRGSQLGIDFLMLNLWQDQILMVIPSVNGGNLLARMLPTLRFKPSNVVVLDQGSTDKTETVCADAGVELVQLGYPRTYTEACNIGARIARGRGGLRPQCDPRAWFTPPECRDESLATPAHPRPQL